MTSFSFPRISRALFVCLVIVLLCGALELLTSKSKAADTLKVGGTGGSLGTMHILADAFMAQHPDVSVEIPQSLGSGGGIRAVIDGVIDIGLSSRLLKPAELERGARQRTYAKTAFVLVTSNMASGLNLTSGELLDIFSGSRVFWENGDIIRVILRPADDSDARILVSAFAGMKGALEQARKLRGVPVAYTDQEAMDKAEKIRGSLTTATIASVQSENRALNPVAIDGVAPTIENVSNGSYRIAKTLYLITGSNDRPVVQEFIRFVQSEAGAEILRRTGHAPAAPAS